MNQSQSRLIIYTGKGGVGKTSISASTGLLSASKNKKTLVISADSANSLGDAFEQKITAEILSKMDNFKFILNASDSIENEKYNSRTEKHTHHKQNGQWHA